MISLQNQRSIYLANNENLNYGDSITSQFADN